MSAPEEIVLRISGDADSGKQAVLQLAEALHGFQGEAHKAGEESSFFGEILGDIFGSFPAKVAEGVLLRDAVHEIIGAIKEGAIEFGIMGSEIKDVHDGFDRLAGGAGQATEILNTMRKGVVGTINDFTLMTDANKLLATGALTSAKDFGTLTEASRVLSHEGFGPTQTLIEGLSTAMETGRIKRLAMMGVTVDAEGEEKRYAASLGLTSKELTAAGKLHADRIAVMKALEGVVVSAGEQEKNLAEKIFAGKVAVENWVHSLAEAIAVSPQVNAAFDAISDSLVKAFGGDSQNMLDTVLGWVNQFADAVREYGPPIITALANTKDEIINIWHSVEAAWNLVPDWFKNIARDAGIAGLAVYAVKEAFGAMGGSDVLGTLANVAQIWSVIGTNVGKASAVVTEFGLAISAAFGAGGVAAVFTVLAETAAAAGAALLALAATPLGIAALLTALGVAAWEVGKAFKGLYDTIHDGKSVWEFLTARDEDTFIRRWLGLSTGAKQAAGDIALVNDGLKGLSDLQLMMKATNFVVGDGFTIPPDVPQGVHKLTEEEKALAKAYADLATVGTSWRDTLFQMDSLTRAYALSMLEADADAGALKVVLGLTEAQMKALQEQIKANIQTKKDEAAWDKEIAREHAEQIKFVADHEKAARDAQQRALKDSNRDIAASIGETNKLWKDYYAIQDSLSLSSTDAQIANIQRWYEEEVRAHQAAGVTNTAYYDALLADANIKIQAIVHANDPIWQASHNMQVDMRMDWANTWEQALHGSMSFGQAFIKTLEDAIVAPFQRMLAALLASWEQQLLGPMIGDAKGAMGAVGGIFSQSGGGGSNGGGGGVNVGGLFGRGVGGKNAPSGMVGGSTGAFDAAGNWVPNSAITGAGLAGAGLLGGVTGAMAVANGASTGSAFAQVGMAAGMTAATTALTTGSIAATAALGAMTFGVGAAAIGVALLIKHFMGVSEAEKEARASFGKFQGQFKNLDGSAMNLAQTIDSVGQAYAYVGKTGTEAEADIKKALDATHVSAAAEKAALEPINAVLQQAADKAKKVDQGFSDIMKAAQAAGGHIPASLQPAVDKLLAMKGLTDQQRAALLALAPAVAPTFDQLIQTADKYGVSLAALGPKFQQSNIDGRAKAIFDDFDALRAAGADVGGVLAGMSDEISKLVQDSLQFGTAIPDNMKPLIEELARAGKLTDDQGHKITDVSKLTFEDTPFDKGVAALTKAIQDLTGFLTGDGGVTDAIDKVGQSASGIPKNPFADWKMPELPGVTLPPLPQASGGLYHVTRPTLFLAGERPGGEDAWFSGVGKRFGAPTSSVTHTGDVNLSVVLPPGNYNDPERLADALADAVKHNTRGLKTKLRQAVAS